MFSEDSGTYEDHGPQEARFPYGPTPDEEAAVAARLELNELVSRGWIVCSAGNVHLIGQYYGWSKTYSQAKLPEIKAKTWIRQGGGYLATEPSSLAANAASITASRAEVYRCRPSTANLLRWTPPS